MDDASLIKTIAQFKIDVTGATTPLKSLQAELLKVDQQVKKIQSSFGAIGQSFSTMGQSFGATGSKISATAKQTGASIQKVTVTTINQLAQIEKQLMSTMSKAGTLGVAIPGAKEQLEIVRQLQDQLMVGQQITEETTEQIQNASMYATLQSRRIATLEKEIVLNKTANTQQQIANASQQRSALAREQALRQQRLQQEKMAQAIMRENALHKQSVFSMEAKVSATMKQLTTHKLTDSHVAQQLTMLRAQIQEYQQLLTSGKILSKIEMDRLRNLQIQLGVLQAQAKTMIADTTAAAKQRAVVPGAGAGGQSVLGSQYERRISWFLAGAGFYGGIRAMQSAVSAMKEVESQMAVIERTTQDATFQLTHMRDELMGIGKEFGHGWSVVSEAAVEWTRAGYNVADTLELVRTSLLALNVAEMDLNQATAGLIAIMSQWGLQAEDLVTVIDKLNIISDRFPVTTGDLIDALLRSSGAARAANIEFDELVGMITATRTASGRAGGEIGNAMNTILSYITRQSTLNKLMASGVEVFEDAAQTKLRPALEIMTDVTDKWLDNAEQMPKELIDIADSMGLFEEELADVVGLQEEWTDLQKVEIEQGIAGVRRRQFLIALMRNFGQVQDVVNNLQEAEGYSMIQNIRAMQTLEKQVEQLRMEMTKLATALGDAGVLGQMKQIVGVGKDVAGFFAGLDSGLQTLILTLGEMTVLFSIVKAVAKMMGAKTVVAALASPYALPSFVGATAIAAYVLHTRQLREEYEQYLKVVSNVAQREEQLNKIINTSIKDTLEHNMAVDEKRELNRAVLEQYPHLLDGYDAENELLLLNQDALKKAVDEQERLNEAKDVYLSDVQKALQEQEQAIENQYKEADGYDKNAKKIEELAKKRESLIKAMQDESLESEKRERYMAQEEDARRIIIDIVGDEAAKRIEAANWSIEAINKEIEAVQEKARITREAARERIKESKAETEQIIKDTVARIEILNQEMKAQSIIGTKELKEEMGWFQWYFNRAKSWLEWTWVGELFDIAPEPWAEHKAEILELEQVIAEAKERLAEYDEELIELIPTIENVGGGTGELSGETQKLSDIINKFIETALRAAEAQGMLNDEIQREMDGLQARINFYDKENATAWERNQVLQDEIRLRELAQQKYEGNHQQANLLREAVEKLRNRQQSLNVTVEEEWQEYKRLESQIESLLDSVSSLGIESFKLKGIINDNTRAIKEMEQAYKDAISTLDYFNRFGIYTTEQYLSEVNRIYSQQGALTLEQERDLYSRRYDAYKQMLNDMKREAEEAYKERIKLLEKETEAQIDNYKKRIELLEKETQATIDAIQRQIDALDEEAERENREEERRKHEEKLQELYDERRYHELRTGREHSQAILDIDKRIMEEKRRWELRQAEWTRQDKKAELQKEIEDVRDAAQQQREILERRIEDIQDAAKRQREVWEETYQRMQDDFSDHNINLLATAAAYDPDFWEDAKNKGEQWVQGFKQGTAGFGDYLSSLTPSAGRVVDSIRDEWERPYYEEPEPEPEPPAKPEPEFPPSYTIEQWGHVYTVKDGGHVILKNGRYIPAEDFKYLPSEILQLARDMKVGKAHTGAMTASAGIAELIPGEMIFPPNLSIQLERLISTLSARPLPAQAQQQWRGGGVEIRGNLLNVEKASFEDETDMEILARELNRQLTSLRN